jgi:putative RNA 2'-phosphotransferase
MSKSVHQLSRFLSLVLRHDPEAIGLSLDPHGWASLADLFEAMKGHGKRIDHATIARVIAASAEPRFELSADGLSIRARHGHSIALHQTRLEKTPPQWLYHGTAATSMPGIVRDGICKQSRDFVHFCVDLAAAKKSGARHGKPVVLEIAAQLMHRHGHRFFVTENNIWLTDHVPPDYLNQRFSR